MMRFVTRRSLWTSTILGAAVVLATTASPTAAYTPTVLYTDPSFSPTPVTELVGGRAELLGMTRVVDISKSGRYALGMIGESWVVRDLDKKRTVRRLPSSPDYAHQYHEISDSGRYVAYSFTDKSDTACKSPWVLDRITNRARPVATTASGRPLPQGWASPAVSDCVDEPKWRGVATYSPPALSGNGRWVAFCANLTVRDRLDLYVKNLRTGGMQTFEGVCAAHEDMFGRPQIPRISETGRVILLPGAHNSGDESGFHVWEPARLLLNHSTFVANVGGAYPRLTDDGSAVFSIGPMACDGGWDPCSAGPKQPIRYDVASGTSTTLAEGDPGPGSTTRRGRYALASFGPWETPSLYVLDRTAQNWTDLTAALTVAGIQPLAPFFTGLWAGGGQERSLISGDGKAAFGLAAGSWEWYRVKLAAAVKIKAVKRKSRLYVNVNPNQGSDYWEFNVQRQRKSGSWKTLPTTYTTYGAGETRRLNFRKGKYRVVVAAKFGHQGTTSASVRLKR